jgi:O-antigen/teichoic acid export membrane protein
VILPYLIGNVALPVLARSAARADGKTRVAARATLIGVPAAGSLLGVLALWLAPTMTVLIFGERYLETGRILAEAVWLLLPMGVAIGLQQIVFSHRCDPWITSLSSVLGIGTMAALYGPLTDGLSYHGALLATGIGAAIWAAGPVIALVRTGILSLRSAGAIATGARY